MFSVSFSCIIQSLLSKFIGSVKLDYGTQWSKLNKSYSIKISGIYMYEWKHVVTIKMVNILMGSTFRNEYMYKDTKKFVKGQFLKRYMKCYGQFLLQNFFLQMYTLSNAIKFWHIICKYLLHTSCTVLNGDHELFMMDSLVSFLNWDTL